MARQAESPRVLSARILSPILRHLADTRGPAAAAALLAGSAPRAKDRRAWLTHAEFEAVLAAARELLGSDDAFQAACAHDLARAYGPIALVFRALSVERVYRLFARTVGLVSRVSTFEVAELGEARLLLRYGSRLPESRLMCLSRMAQFARAPAQFGLPIVRVEERSCIARGDPCCDYVLRWEPPARRA